MRLLHTKLLTLESFTESKSHGLLVGALRDVVPEYAVPTFAILSHTWEEEEVVFEDMQGDQSLARSKAGWAKIIKSCELARSEGYDWIWIDTCCIDKTSSAELSEAINSMFRWYQISAVCYAYLSDATGSQPIRTVDDGLALSPRWYSRGWTLQELIAPPQVKFYNKRWDFVGTREQHRVCISTEYGVDEYALSGGDISRISIARRMAWMSRRETTRIEDMAYCMLGIFSVNMPLLYGEGSNAFIRLQEEILKLSNDQSIFCWRQHASIDSYREEYGDTFMRSGLLADSPRLFTTSRIVSQFQRDRPGRPHAVSTSKGLMVQVLMCNDKCYESGEVYLAVLDCPVGHVPGVMAGIRLKRVSDVSNMFVRVDTPQIFQFAKYDSSETFIDISGFNPTVEQEELICLRMRESYTLTRL
ncbi:unnamed protein product [Parascedosporium putredinis]|uniref:HET-domain-containing protein n=1 Tax=Parascedosporium putredinis TaxID=1442378 RepID=A0A9P1HAJ5_9PEZI|nr:unnamed protein product [Parascedosporium putredinis]CAI8002781.1 unnamed protein product [Parascedosporium putredinis]